MRGIKVLIILIIGNLLLFSNPVFATSKRSILFEDEKVQIAYIQQGKILSKNINLEESLTYRDFTNWLQYFTYDEKKSLLSLPQTNNQKIKMIMKELKLNAIYEKWEKSGSLKKPISYKEMFTILFQLAGYENLSELQVNQLIEVEKLLSKDELNELTKNIGLKKKTGAILFARFIKQFQTNHYITSSQSTTSDKTLFLNEGPSANYQHIVEIPKKKTFNIITKIGNVIIAKYGGKVGFLSNSLSEMEVKNNYQVTANKVNIRLGPSVEYPVVETANMNERVVGKPFNSEWVQIHSLNGKAFISYKYVKIIKTTENNHENNDDTENLVKKVYVLADKLNIRAEQSVTSRIIGTVLKGEVLEVITKYSKWTKIKYKNIVGFVSNEFISEQPISINKEIVIAIDAGHGGKDPGAHSNQLNEKDITLDTALKIRDEFNDSNIQVILTRETDVFLNLSERVNIAKKNKAILFVSIHVNSGSGEHGGGTETYYYGNSGKNPYISESKSLATFIQAKMIDAWHLTDRGEQHGNFQVIRDNSMPAVLTELGFIDSKKDQKYLSSSSQRTIMARAIHDGIISYLKSEGYKITQSS